MKPAGLEWFGESSGLRFVDDIDASLGLPNSTDVLWSGQGRTSETWRRCQLKRGVGSRFHVGSLERLF